MTNTLYKRCPNCDQFIPEIVLVCTRCGHSLDSPPSKSPVKIWRIVSLIFGVMLLLYIVSFIFTNSPTPDKSASSILSRPTWTNTPQRQPATPTPTPKPTRTPRPTPIVALNKNMNVRGGPGTYYPIIGMASPDQQFPITGKNPVGDWWQINYKGLTGWIYAPLVTAINADGVQIAIVIPVPLTPAQIFSKVSPAIVFVQTADASGSGVLVEGRHLVTNAHVVWPFDEARVVFPNGAAYDAVPVKGWDREADLAVLGPINTAMEPVPLVDGESAPIGADMYLIGYPGEFESFPQPTIVKGILSRLRQNRSVGITYFQIDATITGGQSGGALVSETGAVIGISGFSIADGKFAMGASAADLLPRIRQLIAGGGAPFRPRREARVVHYDGGIDLRVFALEQGEKRLSSQDLANLRRDLPLWVGMQWQTAPGLGVDYAISLRLHDTRDRKVYQQDEVLTNSESRPTSYWSAHEPVDTWFQFDFPADLLPGVYELRLVVYNIRTLTPTVEIDVWKPEVFLTRLRWARLQR